MKDIKVLGSGCAACKKTAEMIARLAEEAGVPVKLEKIEDIQAIMAYQVMSTPAVVVDGKVVHAGGIPSRSAVLAWLKES